MKLLTSILSDTNLINDKNTLSNEDERKFESFLQILEGSKILYRYIGNGILRKEFNSDTTNIEVLSKHIFLYGDKGRLFYETKITDLNRNFDNVENRVFENLYDKLFKIFVNTDSLNCENTKNAISKLSCFFEIQSYFKNTSKENWIEYINKLAEKERAIVKNYYISYLHTIGKSGIGNESYFLSTSIDYEFCNNWRKEDLNKKGIVLVGWIGKQDYVKTWNKKNHDIIRLNGLPILDDTLFKNQQEITLLCGMLPHYIIGFLYEKSFIVNPYVFKIVDIKNVRQEGLPVDQTDFQKNIKQTNLKSFYSMFGDLYYYI